MDEKENKFAEGFRKAVDAPKESSAPQPNPNSGYYIENKEEGKRIFPNEEAMNKVIAKGLNPAISHKIYRGGKFDKEIPIAQKQENNSDKQWILKNANKINNYMDEREKQEQENKLKYDPSKTDLQMKEQWKNNMQSKEVYDKLSKILGIGREEIENLLKSNDANVSNLFNSLKQNTPQKSEDEARNALIKSENEFVNKEDKKAGGTTSYERFDDFLAHYRKPDGSFGYTEQEYNALPKEIQDKIDQEFSKIAHKPEELAKFNSVQPEPKLEQPEQPKPAQPAPVSLGSKLAKASENFKGNTALYVAIQKIKDLPDEEIDAVMEANPEIAQYIGFDKIKGGK